MDCIGLTAGALDVGLMYYLIEATVSMTSIVQAIRDKVGIYAEIVDEERDSRRGSPGIVPASMVLSHRGQFHCAPLEVSNSLRVKPIPAPAGFT